MIEIHTAIDSGDVANRSTEYIKQDLEARIKKAILSDMNLNLPRDIEYVATAGSFGELDRKMGELYKNDLIKSDCHLVKIKIEVKVEMANK